MIQRRTGQTKIISLASILILIFVSMLSYYILSHNYHLMILISTVIIVGFVAGRISFLYFENIKKINSPLYARYGEELFCKSTDYIIITDLDGKIICINDSCSSLFQLNPSHLIQAEKSLFTILEAFPSAPMPPILEAWSSIKKGTPVQWESKILKSENKEISVLWSSVPDVKKNIVYSIGRDISEIRKYEMRVLSASKMVSLSQISAGIAHEINNPLTIIRGRVELIKRQLAKEVPDLNKIRSYLDNTDEMVTRAASIIDALRIFTLSSSSTDVNPNSFSETWALPLVEKSFNLFRERLGKRKIRVEINLKSDDFKIYCREKEIIHILNILIANSIDAIQKLPQPWISCDVHKNETHTIITFRDSGRGIRHQDSEKIMEPFYTTKAQGTGLGLSIARGLISGHGGTLELDPAQENTTFVIKLPHSNKPTNIEVYRQVS